MVNPPEGLAAQLTVPLLAVHYVAAVGLRGPRPRSRPLVSALLFGSTVLSSMLLISLGWLALLFEQRLGNVVIAWLLLMAAGPGWLAVLRWSRFLAGRSGRLAALAVLTTLTLVLPGALISEAVAGTPEEPWVNGRVLAYVRDARQPLRMHVFIGMSVPRLVDNGEYVIISIERPAGSDRTSTDWGIAFVGDGRLRDLDVSLPAKVGRLGDHAIVTGTLSPKDELVRLSGYAWTRFSSASFVEQVAELPLYGIDQGSWLDKSIRQAHGNLVAPNDFAVSVNVDTGIDEPRLLRMRPKTDVERSLLWTSKFGVAPGYRIEDSVNERQAGRLATMSALGTGLLAAPAAVAGRRLLTAFLDGPVWRLEPEGARPQCGRQRRPKARRNRRGK